MYALEIPADLVARWCDPADLPSCFDPDASNSAEPDDAILSTPAPASDGIL